MQEGCTLWHNHVHVSLGNLEWKGLVESCTILGENFAGTQILRKVWSLNPARVSRTARSRDPLRRRSRRLKRKLKPRPSREKEAIRLERELSPKPKPPHESPHGRKLKDMRIICPKCGRPGSLQRYSKGKRYRHDYRRSQYYLPAGRRIRCYIPFKRALAIEAAASGVAPKP